MTTAERLFKHLSPVDRPDVHIESPSQYRRVGVKFWTDDSFDCRVSDPEGGIPSFDVSAPDAETLADFLRRYRYFDPTDQLVGAIRIVLWVLKHQAYCPDFFVDLEKKTLGFQDVDVFKEYPYYDKSAFELLREIQTFLK